MHFFIFFVLPLFSFADHLEPVHHACGYTFFYPRGDGTQVVGLELTNPSPENYPESDLENSTPPFKYRLKGGDRFMFINADNDSRDLNLVRADYIAATKNSQIKNINLCISEGRRSSLSKNGRYDLYPISFEMKESKKIFLNPSEIPGHYENTNITSKMVAYPSAQDGVSFFAEDGDPLQLFLIRSFPSCKGLLPPFNFNDLKDSVKLQPRQSKETLVQTLTIPCGVTGSNISLQLTLAFTKETSTQDIALQLVGKIIQSVDTSEPTQPLILNLLKKTKS